MHSSSFHRASIRCAVAAAALALPAAAAWAGPVQIVSQERSVRANAQTETEEVTAPDAGRFNESVSAEFSNDERTSSASASQDSTLGDDAFTFAGTLSYSVQEAEDVGAASAVATSTFYIDFVLDESRSFSLTRSSTLTNEDEFSFRDDVFQFSAEGDGASIDATSDGPNSQGTLTAGRYRLASGFQLENEGSNSDLHDASLDYSVVLAFDAIDDGGGGGGETPIPLPPAAWAGLGTFACYGASRLLGRRFRRA